MPDDILGQDAPTDTSAIAAEIASSFGGGEQPSSGGTTPVEVQPPAPTSPEAGIPAPTPALRPLPKSWKKDMEAYWGKLDPAVHDYVYSREADVARGIQGYKQGHESWNKLVTPYQEVFQQFPDVDPVNLLNGLMQSHLALTFGSPDQKRELVQKLLQEYNLNDVLGGQTPQAPPRDPRVDQLESTMRSLMVDQQKKVVDSFFSNPANKFANDVAEDLLAMLQQGKAATLEEAYQAAIWLNPAVREKLIAEQVAAKATPPANPSNVRQLNVGTEAPARPGKRSAASIDDTINAVIGKHYPAGGSM